MKLLLDHNLSPRLVRLLSDVFPECTHVHDLGMNKTSDTQVWRYAAEHDYTIVSKDADFHQRSPFYRLLENHVSLGYSPARGWGSDRQKKPIAHLLPAP